VLNSAIPFFILPILTRFLSPADYGIVSTFQVLVGFASPFVGLSINGSIARTFFNKEPIDHSSYIANCLYLLFGCTLIVGIIIWLIADPVSTLVMFPKNWLWSVVLVASGQYLSLVVLTVWQFQTKPFQYSMFQVVLTALSFGLSLWLIVGLGFKWEGLILAQVVSAAITVVAGLIVLFKGKLLKFGINKSYIYSAVIFGVPLIPHAFGGWLTSSADRIFISNMAGLSDTGIYAVGYQVTQVIILIETSFNTAFAPWLYKQLSEDNPIIKRKIVRFTYVYVICMIIFALLFSIVAPYLLNYLVGKDFRGASKFIIWLALARSFDAMYFMTCNYIFYVGRTSAIASATFLSAIVHVSATYVLIKMNGAVGAAQAAVISSLLCALLVWWLASRFYKMPWRECLTKV
jgi:O-antigen/teichoic acid export membrane protein